MQNPPYKYSLLPLVINLSILFLDKQEGKGVTRKPYLPPNLSHAHPAPATETKIEISHNL